jgi:ribonuclease J
MLSFRKQLENVLRKVNHNKSNYLILCTGHQGEPGSILDRIARDQLPIRLSSNDQVIFSSKTIPTPINEANRFDLGKRLKKHGARIFDNIHVSGHGGREDIRDLIRLLNPEHIIPSHCDLKKQTGTSELAQEMGYTLHKTVHLMQNGQTLITK